MELKNRGNLIISGIGSAGGGTYNKVKIEGKGKVEGDLDCIDFVSNGQSDIQGSVKAHSVTINGGTDIEGHLRSDKININGKAKIDGNVSGEHIGITGFIAVKGNCEAESFVFSGGLTIDGLLNAGTIDFTIYHGCEIREIGGEKIEIRNGKFEMGKVLKLMFLSLTSKLTTQSIEGDEIYLENTKAKVVRGNNVTIGAGCEIDLVEYKGAYQQEKGAKVNQHKKI